MVSHLFDDTCMNAYSWFIWILRLLDTTEKKNKNVIIWYIIKLSNGHNMQGVSQGHTHYIISCDNEDNLILLYFFLWVIWIRTENINISITFISLREQLKTKTFYLIIFEAFESSNLLEFWKCWRFNILFSLTRGFYYCFDVT